jgi:regulatory protein
MRQPFPGIITAMAPQAKTRRHLGERANIFIDGKFSFALDDLLVEKYGLQRGQTLDRERLAQLLQEDGDAKAYARALHFLSYRPRSTGEVRQRLQRDWPDEVIERVLSRLQREGHLSDEQFAGLWVEHRTLSRPRGAYVLRQEMRQKGVAREIIHEALPRDAEEQENAVAALRSILQSKERAWRDLDPRSRQQKALQALQRRGFAFSVARAAWQRLHEEEA